MHPSDGELRGLHSDARPNLLGSTLIRLLVVASTVLIIED